MILFPVKKAFVFIVGITVFAITACSPSYVKPDHSAGQSTLTLTLQSPELKTRGDRAVVEGGGYLYIRTFGGPSGEISPFYGPYQAKGTAFSITDIPPGSYRDMLLVYSSTELGKLFSDLMGDSDSQLYDLIKSSDANNPLNSAIDGYASAGFTGAKTVVPSNNSIRLSLVPVCGDSSTVGLTATVNGFSGSFAITDSAAFGSGRFLKLDVSSIPTEWGTRYLYVSSDIDSLSLALYDDAGNVISDFGYDTAKALFSLTTSVKYATLFLYINAPSVGTLQFSIFPAAKAISSFSFEDLGVTGVVDETAKTITAIVPYGSNVTALVPTIVHSGTSISPLSGVAQDFSNPVTYAVTALDGTTQTYAVTVNQAPPPVMQMVDVDSEAVLSGATIYYGTVMSGSPQTKTYTIKNTGSGSLVLTSASLSNGTTIECLSFTLPLLPAIPPGGERTLTILFTVPVGHGYRTDTEDLEIDSNDPSAPFILNLTGTCSGS